MIESIVFDKTNTHKGSSLKTSLGICEEPFGDTSPTELHNKKKFGCEF